MRKNFKNEGYQDFSEYQLQMLNKDFYNIDRKRSLESVLAKLMKHSENNILKMSLSKLHEISCYGRYKTMARSYFYELVDQLIELKLVKRVGRKIHIIISPDNLPDKMEVAESVETTGLDGNSEKPNIKLEYDLYTNTNIVKMLKGFYKGLSGRVNATKKDLQDIAKCLFVLNRVDSALVQHAVFSKIKYSKRNINLAGAVAYVEAIVMEKLGDYEANFVC